LVWSDATFPPVPPQTLSLRMDILTGKTDP
jgi:hypothetical protein